MLSVGIEARLDAARARAGIVGSWTPLQVLLLDRT
jgi:hypothetical protein